MPYIVVIIDELADLMMVVGKKVEGADRPPGAEGAGGRYPPCSATQRAERRCHTGLIKANIPTRLSPGVEQDRFAHHPRSDGGRGIVWLG